MRVYLDYAATTPLCEPAKKAIIEGLDFFGNPSSTHSFGREVKARMEASRRSISSQLGVRPYQILFTSGATEALNTAMRSCAHLGEKKKVYTDRLEHHATIDPLEKMHKDGFIDLVFLPNDSLGVLDISPLKNAPEGSIVCLMHFNNEIGNCNPIHEIGAICESKNLIFICDMVQAIGQMRINLTEIPGLCYAVASSHKFNGPKGVGLLYIAKGRGLNSLLLGGAQERGLRAGTENTIAIQAMSAALDWNMSNVESNRAKKQKRSTEIIERLKIHRNIIFNGLGGREGHHPAIINFSFEISGDPTLVVFNLDLKGLALSQGSACMSGSTTGSHVLQAMACVPPNHASIRLSHGVFTTEEEIEYSLSVLDELIQEKVEA